MSSLHPEILFDPRNEELLRVTDDTEQDAATSLAIISQLLHSNALAAISPETAAKFQVFYLEIINLLIAYKLQKITTNDLYTKYEQRREAFLATIFQYDAEQVEDDALSPEEIDQVRETIRIKLEAHRIAVDSLAPGAVLRSIKKSLEFDQNMIAHAQQQLSSYRRVDVVHSRQELRITATTDKVATQLIEKLVANPEITTVVVNAPPGSGKTIFMDSMEVLIRAQGWEVVQINFDKVIAKFFEREKKETKSWSSLTAEEFDNSFFDLQQLIKQHYPQAYQDKRIIVMIDTLGYNIDQMLYGLWLIGRRLKEDINEGKALVMTLIAQPAVFEKAKTQRSEGGIDKRNAKDAAKLLAESKGAPIKAMERHDQQLTKKVRQTSKESAFQRIVKSTDTSAIAKYVPERELIQMVERLAYAILTKNEQEISENWWFVFNLFQEEGEELRLD